MSMEQHVSSDTICALSTPPGVGGIAVIRISGPDALAAAHRFFRGPHGLLDAESHRIYYGWWMDGEVPIDSVVCSVFRSPHSYTGEDVVEVSCHGGYFVSRHILSMLYGVHIRSAAPGEFTQRAFLNGRLDMTQVEAVADLIHAQSSPGSLTAARQLAGGFTRRIAAFRQRLLDTAGLLELELDFSEEDVEFVDRSALRATLTSLASETHALQSTAKAAETLRSGFTVAMVGFPNAGKSSLFNAFLQEERAIVSDIPGTTRDYIRESIIVDGFTVHLVDTAGIRSTDDTIELQGISLTESVIKQANAVLIINDASEGLTSSDALVDDILRQFSPEHCILIQNKMDLVGTSQRHDVATVSELYCSARRGEGMEVLRTTLRDMVAGSASAINDVLLNRRQADVLSQVTDSLHSAVSGLDVGLTSEYIAVDLRQAIRFLGELTGETWNPDVLEGVFSKFCIGK